ncbi:MAG: lysozyme inhibitor LprI family protein [Spirosomataceae bacterium]
MKTLTFILVGTIVFSTACLAQDKEQKSTIDAALEKCMDKNPSTHGTMSCIIEAQKQWDAELNKHYKTLNLKLNPEQKAALLNAQREWIKWRDLEFKSIDALYSTLEGTMFQPMQLNSKMEVVKQRALALKHYSELMEMN